MNRFYKPKKIQYNGNFLILNFVSEKEKNAFLHDSKIDAVIQKINKKTLPDSPMSSDDESSDSDLDDTPISEEKSLSSSSLKLEISKAKLSEDERNQIIKAVEVGDFFPKSEIESLKSGLEKPLALEEQVEKDLEAEEKFCLYIRRHR